MIKKNCIFQLNSVGFLGQSEFEKYTIENFRIASVK